MMPAGPIPPPRWRTWEGRMSPEMVLARSAIESLRSGVPSRHAVTQLGTTQQEIKTQFDAALDALTEGRVVQPIVIVANFGAGKSHLLEYLQSVAAQQQFVTSYVVVSPEMPLGNAHGVLKALAESAQAPERLGKALHALAFDFNTTSQEFARLRLWAREADIQDRFRALLHLYEEFRADQEFRIQILEDFEGKPLLKTTIRQRLKELGELAAYDLGSPRNAFLAHDRIRLLAQFYRACRCKGLVVLFDELERIAKFSLNQRIAAYRELGWWAEVAAQAGSAILPVFAMTDNFLDEVVFGGKSDVQRFVSSVLGSQDERDQQATQGIELLRKHSPLRSAPEHDEEIKYRIKSLYELAYGVRVPALPKEGQDVRTTIRSEIRRWITLWDLHRYYPEYAPQVEEESLTFD
jgi:hypothetical protein